MKSVHSPGSRSVSALEMIPASLDGATGSIRSSENAYAAAQRSLPPPASTMPFAAPDLTDSHGLLEAIEDMHNQPDVGALLSAVADYGTTIIPTDGIAILKRAAGGWQPATIRAVNDVSHVVCVEQTVELLAAEGWFQHVKRVDDLSQDQRWGQLPLPSSARTWRSLLIVASERQNHADIPVTIVWWSRRTGAFAEQGDIAVLFARTARLAIHNVNTRDNLAQAVLARHRAGMAQGILMSRLGCSQDHAIAVLKYRSQRTNRKLRTIADEVIRSVTSNPLQQRRNATASSEEALPFTEPSQGRSGEASVIDRRFFGFRSLRAEELGAIVRAVLERRYAPQLAAVVIVYGLLFRGRRMHSTSH